MKYGGRFGLDEMGFGGDGFPHSRGQGWGERAATRLAPTVAEEGWVAAFARTRMGGAGGHEVRSYGGRRGMGRRIREDKDGGSGRPRGSLLRWQKRDGPPHSRGQGWGEREATRFAPTVAEEGWVPAFARTRMEGAGGHEVSSYGGRRGMGPRIREDKDGGSARSRGSLLRWQKRDGSPHPRGQEGSGVRRLRVVRRLGCGRGGRRWL